MDRYKGIQIKDMNLLPSSESEFDIQLTECLDHWKKDGARSIQIFFKPPKC